MLKKILIGVGALLVVLLVVAAFQPSAWAVSRSATLPAPPAAVFAQVNDLHAWEAWSPWQKLDPAMKQVYEGPAAGAGASQSWEGNDDVGKGRLTILESRPDELVRLKLEFIEPWEATSTTEFTFAPAAGGTLVTWTMKGENNYMCKLMSMFMDMDKMIGADFEKGLASMGAVVAKSSPSR